MIRASRVEEYRAARGGAWQVAQFVQDHEIKLDEAFGKLSGLFLGLLLFKSVDQRDGREETNPAEFTFHENWTDRGAWDKHMELPHLQAFADVKDKIFELQKLRLMTMVTDAASAR